MLLAEVSLRRLDGARAVVLTDFERLRVENTLDDIGGAVLQVGGDELRVLDLYESAQPDMLMEVRWRDDAAGILPRLELTGLVLDRDVWRDENGWHVQITAAGLRHLLTRVICVAGAGTAGAVKSGPAETVVKGFVSQEITRVAYPDFTITPSAGTGPSITINGFNKSLLAICRQAHQLTGGDFVLTSTPAAHVSFDWLSGGMGTDRRATLRFGLSYGNVTNPRLIRQRSKQISHAIVLGQGEGGDRDVVIVHDPVLAGESKWGRIESSQDARDVPKGGLTQLAERGREVLWGNAAVRRWEFEVLQTEGTRYGREYFLGDRVRAELGRDWVDRIIAQVVVSIAPDQPPTVEITTKDIVG